MNLNNSQLTGSQVNQIDCPNFNSANTYNINGNSNLIIIGSVNQVTEELALVVADTGFLDLDDTQVEPMEFDEATIVEVLETNQLQRLGFVDYSMRIFLMFMALQFLSFAFKSEDKVNCETANTNAEFSKSYLDNQFDRASSVIRNANFSGSITSPFKLVVDDQGRVFARSLDASFADVQLVFHGNKDMNGNHIALTGSDICIAK